VALALIVFDLGLGLGLGQLALALSVLALLTSLPFCAKSVVKPESTACVILHNVNVQSIARQVLAIFQRLKLLVSNATLCRQSL